METLKKFFRKPFRWAALYSAFLTAASALALLDVFVIPRAMAQALEPAAPAQTPVPALPPDPGDMLLSAPPAAAPAFTVSAQSVPALPPTPAEAVPDSGAGRGALEIASTAAAIPPEAPAPPEAGPAADSGDGIEKLEKIEKEAQNPGPLITAHAYADEHISITIETYRKNDTTIYLADLVISSVEYLKTALAKNTYGRNIRDTSSAMAAEHGAILAINGDYYGFRDSGFVLRNGTLYRGEGNGEALLMDWGGDLRCAGEAGLTRTDIEEAWQIWSFGPALIRDGKIAVGAGAEIKGRSAPSNPRTAIGQAGPLHYVMIVSDGRTRTDRGLSLLELAEEFAARGCTIAYNLDGGGSSSMVFNGQVLNRPTTNGRTIGEREVSDIVYIGYR